MALSPPQAHPKARLASTADSRMMVRRRLIEILLHTRQRLAGPPSLLLPSLSPPF